jgi:hypothetical protein
VNCKDVNVFVDKLMTEIEEYVPNKVPDTLDLAILQLDKYIWLGDADAHLYCYR